MVLGEVLSIQCYVMIAKFNLNRNRYLVKVFDAVFYLVVSDFVLVSVKKVENAIQVKPNLEQSESEHSTHSAK